MTWTVILSTSVIINRSSVENFRCTHFCPQNTSQTHHREHHTSKVKTVCITSGQFSFPTSHQRMCAERERTLGYSIDLRPRSSNNWISRRSFQAPMGAMSYIIRAWFMEQFKKQSWIFFLASTCDLYKGFCRPPLNRPEKIGNGYLQQTGAGHEMPRLHMVGSRFPGGWNITRTSHSLFSIIIIHQSHFLDFLQPITTSVLEGWVGKPCPCKSVPSNIIRIQRLYNLDAFHTTPFKTS